MGLLYFDLICSRDFGLEPGLLVIAGIFIAYKYEATEDLLFSG